MTNWVEIKYINGYGKHLGHTFSTSKVVRDVKEVLGRYGVRSDDITEFIVDGEIKDIEKVRDFLR